MQLTILTGSSAGKSQQELIDGFNKWQTQNPGALIISSSMSTVNDNGVILYYQSIIWK